MAGLVPTVNVYNVATSGYTIEKLVADGPTVPDSYYQLAANRNSDLFWGGTNNSGGSAVTTVNYLGAYCRAREQRGFQCATMDMMSRSGADAFKNAYDNAIRQGWTSWASAFVDIAADPNLGCDGCSANTEFMSGGLHMTVASAANIGGPYMQRGLNRLYGHKDWSSATTYVSPAAAATAITAASESGSTVTITSTLNPPAGSCAVISGVTPSDYNNISGECWNVLTTSANEFHLHALFDRPGTGNGFRHSVGARAARRRCLQHPEFRGGKFHA